MKGILSYKEFKGEIFKEFKKEYDNEVRLKKEKIFIEKNNLEAEIDIYSIFTEYILEKNFNLIVKRYKKTIKELFENTKLKVDYKKVYPVIKNKEFGKGEKLDFLRENLFLNLDILYGIDMGESIRFILEKEKSQDFEKIKENALNNLKIRPNGLTRIDKDFNIYGINVLNDYVPSYFLLESFKKIIEEKVGKNYLFAMPSSTSFFVAQDNPVYIDILRRLGEIDTDPNKVSNLIYRCRDGIYNYAEPKNILKVIK